MVDTPRVLDIRDDGKQTRAVPGRHSQILRLERERQRQFLIAEDLVHHIEQRLSDRDLWKRGDQLPRQQTGRLGVRNLQTRIELLEALALAAEELVVAVAMTREAAFDLLLHVLVVVGGLHPFVGKLQAVHRVELLHLHPLVADRTRVLERLVSNLYGPAWIAALRPPTLLLLSKTLTRHPRRARIIAAVSPPGPAPITMTCLSDPCLLIYSPSVPEQPAEGPL
jgi:hypothetical protein